MKAGLTRLGRTALLLAAVVGFVLADSTRVKVLCAAYVLGDLAVEDIDNQSY